MTREEILAMEAGREFDTLVAEKVMGHSMPDFIPEHALGLYLAGTPIHYDSWTCVCRYDEGDTLKWVPDPYSSDISAAWQVVEKMIGQEYNFELSSALAYTTGGEFEGANWYVAFTGGLEDKTYDTARLTAPSAICVAALLAKFEEAKIAKMLNMREES